MYILYITLTDRRVKRHVPINMKILYTHKKSTVFCPKINKKVERGHLLSYIV